MKEIADLIAELRDSDDKEALVKAFVAAHEFPLTDADTATFFFWDGQPADDVRLVNWVYGLESSQPLQPIDGTNALYLPVELPHAARVEYKFEVWRGGNRRWVRDPLNERLARDPFGANSVCEMPGYEDPAWADPEELERRGELMEINVPSEVWGETRHVALYLPFEYRRTKSYPLLICHDGSDYLRFAAARNVLDRLIRRHEVAPLIVAFVNPGGARNAEYAANPKQADFIVNDLLPFLTQRLGEPSLTGLMGASFGAVSTLFTTWKHPGVFDRVLLQSGSFAFTDIGQHDRGPLWDPVVDFVNQFRADPSCLRDARTYMSCGCFESLIYYNRSLVPLMRRSGLSLRYVESLDGHNWISWRDRLRDGLTYLFPGHLWMYYE
jgi:enterochelin esterase-like enzyme